MLSPFPGMNPYLENPDLWAEVHHWLITLIANSLVPHLRPKYRVAIEKRVYQTVGEETVLVGIPDVSVGRSTTDSNDPVASTIAVASPPRLPVTVTIPMPEEEREGYLEVREVGTGAVVTTIEILSPKNKHAGEGRKSYETKRQKVLSSETHLVEIDLLRGGKPMPIMGRFINTSYRILVSRSNYRPKAELYPFELIEPIPTFSLPLRQGDTEPLLDLQALVQEVYDRAGLDMAINYTHKPIPELSEADEIWADNLLRQQGLR
ncbi:hypothetical protein NIES4071_38930 [Calothrix sp. NIES-4071]|nr:hypothetical protein NIES4071_38930 [Calothrix sp. NIES-4071]BAZ58211.1 hypothetical protein NIES4105_38870 [Calothrix sp. NIES-4105]